MSQRSIHPWQIVYALDLGKQYNRAGAEWRLVRRKDIPPEERGTRQAEKTVGLVVCIERGVIETVYYRDKPSHYIRCKPKGSYRAVSRKPMY